MTVIKRKALKNARISSEEEYREIEDEIRGH